MGHLSRYEWFVAEADKKSAYELVKAFHYSRSHANVTVACHGLFKASDSQLYGAALWMPPTANAARTVSKENWRGVLNLSRLVVHPDVPTNGASFLLGRSMKLLDRSVWPYLVTYADTLHGHKGAIYRATNWKCVGEVKGGDMWVGPNGEQRGRKRGKVNLTAQQMRDQGFTRLPRMPKIKFVHGVEA